MIKKLISIVMGFFLSLFLLGTALLTFASAASLSLGVSEMIRTSFSGESTRYTITVFLMTVVLIFVIIGIGKSLELVYIHYKEEAYSVKFTQGLSLLSKLTLIISFILIALGLYTLTYVPFDLFDVAVVFGFIVVLWILAAVIELVRVIVLDTIEFKDENELVV